MRLQFQRGENERNDHVERQIETKSAHQFEFLLGDTRLVICYIAMDPWNITIKSEGKSSSHMGHGFHSYVKYIEEKYIPKIVQ